MNIAKKNERQSFTFQLIRAKGPGGRGRFEFVGPKGRSDRTLLRSTTRTSCRRSTTRPAEVQLVPLDVTTTARLVGYVEGAGDAVPQAIEQLGVGCGCWIPPTTLDDLRGGWTPWW